MTHYEKLGISKSSTQEEIKNAYKDLVKKYHPDVYQGDKSFAEKMTKEINVAYDVLSDPTKRAEYDEEINPTPTYSQSTYNYTPPKYDTPPSNYNDYRRYYGREYNYNNRYTNYYSNKTTSSNYSETSHFEKKIINLLDTNKLVVIFLILIIYVTLFIVTFCQFYAFRNNKYTGTITNPQKVENENLEPNNNVYKSNPTENIYSFPQNYEDFNINDYISDSDLYNLYSQYYFNKYESYSEFKEIISKELFDYYYTIYH